MTQVRSKQVAAINNIMYTSCVWQCLIPSLLQSTLRYHTYKQIKMLARKWRSFSDVTFFKCLWFPHFVWCIRIAGSHGIGCKDYCHVRCDTIYRVLQSVLCNQFAGDPWIQFRNVYFEVYLFLFNERNNDLLKIITELL
jgi:hypothetical protein